MCVCVCVCVEEEEEEELMEKGDSRRVMASLSFTLQVLPINILCFGEPQVMATSCDTFMCGVVP